jgi:hypothetical protein
MVLCSSWLNLQQPGSGCSELMWHFHTTKLKQNLSLFSRTYDRQWVRVQTYRVHNTQPDLFHRTPVIIINRWIQWFYLHHFWLTSLSPVIGKFNSDIGTYWKQKKQSTIQFPKSHNYEVRDEMLHNKRLTRQWPPKSNYRENSIQHSHIHGQIIIGHFKT